MQTKTFLLLFVLVSAAVAGTPDGEFQQHAADLAQRLKQQLVQQLSAKIAQDGAVKAIPFCHAQVKPIAKSAAGQDLERFEFGRTSHRVRQLTNRAQEWMQPYLSEFQGSSQSNPASARLHHWPDGKRAYLEPLYVQPLCLTCHGTSVSKEIRAEVAKLYPQDQATGFKLGEFRGMIWVKEK